MIGMNVMEAAIYQVINVIAMRHRLMGLTTDIFPNVVKIQATDSYIGGVTLADGNGLRPFGGTYLDHDCRLDGPFACWPAP